MRDRVLSEEPRELDTSGAVELHARRGRESANKRHRVTARQDRGNGTELPGNTVQRMEIEVQESVSEVVEPFSESDRVAEPQDTNPLRSTR